MIGNEYWKEWWAESLKSLCFTSDSGVVVIRVRIIEVVDLDPLSLQLLQFGLQISLGS